MQKIQFSDMELSNEMQRAVEEMGFEEPTSIQAASIPMILSGRDVIGHSQTGTGKTAAFSIPAIEKINPAGGRKTQVLILCPTRELAVQACDEIRKFAKYKPFLKVVPIYGGQPIERQFTALRGGAQIVVGTPGRVMDHMRRGTLKLDTLHMIILDEADEMLSMGFREDIETILKDVPQERQTILFSATMSPEIMRITKQYQTDPELIRITREQLTVPNIEQTYYEVPVGKKTEVLSRLLDVYNPSRSIVFCNTKKQVDELVEELHARGYQARGLHGDMKQGERTQIMNGFRRGSIDILVATDVAARGIDVEDIAAVFNYDIPQDVEYYVHRIGRTGRIGKEGRAFTFVTGRRQIYELRDIERFTKSKITLKAVPSSSEVNETNERKFLDRVRVVLEEGGLEEYTPYTDALLEDYASLDISAALIKMLLKKEQRGRRPSRADDELFAAESRRNRMERDPRRRERGGNMRPNAARRSSSPRRDDANIEKISSNLGRKHHVSASHLLGAVAGESGLPGKSFGRIENLDNCTLVSVPREHVKLVIDRMKGCKIMGYQTVTRKLT